MKVVALDDAENIYGHQKKLRYIREQISRFAGPRPLHGIQVLDFGCGNGTAVSLPLAAMGIRLTGLDIHAASIDYAQRNAAENASFVCGSLEDLSGSFDIIVCADILEHLSDPLTALKKLRKVHRSGGILIGAVPNGQGPFELENKLQLLCNSGRWAAYAADIFFKLRFRLLGLAPPSPPASGDTLPYNSDSTHVQFFRFRDFISLAERAGYEVTDFKPGVFMGSPACSAQFLAYSERFIRWNARVANRLPLRFVSTWYFTWRAR